MSRIKPKHRFRPRFEGLENRGLLSSTAQFLGFSPVDMTGPTAAVGPGGYRNLDIDLAIPLSPDGQPVSLHYLNIAGPTGFQWTYGNQGSGASNPQAASNITIGQGVIDSATMTESFEISISPVVLDASSSSMLSLPDGSRLSMTATYTAGSGPLTTDTPQSDPALVVMASGLSPFPADPSPALPALGFGTYSGTAQAQTSDGNGHIRISGLPINPNLPSGSPVINASTADLSDVAGLYWNVGSTLGRVELGMNISYSTNSDHTVNADLAFPPERDEAGSTMTFRFQLNGSSTEYVTDIAMGTVATDPNLRDGGPIDPKATLVMVSPTSSATPNLVTYSIGGVRSQPVDIQTLLNMGFQNIELTDGSTGGIYTIGETLNIPSGMILQGADSNVTLLFTMSSVPQGVINFASSHITLKGFNIRFENSTVDFTGLGGNSPAIISDVEEQPGVLNQQNQHSRVDLNLENLNIHAPYVPFSPNTADVSDMNPLGAVNTVDTVVMGDFDSGTITGNTIYGGTVLVDFGPWQISGNQVLGAVKGTLSDGAFSVDGGHDVTIGGPTIAFANTVTDLDPAQNGGIDRFLAANGSGYDFNVSSNMVGVAHSAVGNIGIPAPNPNGPYSGNPRNNPELILFEDYRKTFEGSVLSVGVSSSNSSGNDRRLIAIPDAVLDLFSGGLGNSGLTLTVLDGPNAGTSIPVLQSFDSEEAGSSGVTDFLLATSLPRGTFDLDISPAYVNPVLSGNTLNMSGTISTGLVLTTTIVNAQITDNTFEGDRSSETTNYGLDQSQAIRFDLHGAHDNDSGSESYNVMSATIADNTIINAIGGIKLYLDANLPTTYGRSYGFLTLADNTFRYNYQDSSLLSINVDVHVLVDNNTGYHQEVLANDAYSQLVGGSVVYDPSAASFVDPRTLVINASGNSVLWSGVAAPWTDVTVNAAEINGVLYEANATPNPSLLPSSTGSATQVDLSSQYNKVGITADGASQAGGFDTAGNSYSANALTSSVVWDGQSFHFGPPGINDVEALGGVPIPTTPGNDTDLLLLGASNNGSHAVTFMLNYATGPAVAYTQTFSDWVGGYSGPGTTAPGESIAKVTSYFNTYNASTGLSGRSNTTTYLYGYDIPIDPTRTLVAVTTSNNNQINVFAADFVSTTSVATVPNLGDSGFETVRVGNNGFVYNPVGSSWTFSGSPGNGSGLSGNNSGFTSGNPTAPEGSQVAFLQSHGSITQSVAGWAAGTYRLSFDAAQRGNYGTSAEDFEVLVDGSVVGIFKPASNSYGVSTTSSFAVSAGAHVIEFLGLDSSGGDNTVFIDDVTIAVAAPSTVPTVADSGFEAVPLAAGTFAYNPTGSAWTFSGSSSNGSGLTTNNSGFTYGTPGAPQGSQVAFLQATGSITQSVVGWAAGTYRLSFDAAQRGNYGTSVEDFEVLVDGSVVGTFKPGSTSYRSYSTGSFVVTAGAHTIEFLGLDSSGGDNTAFIDDVSIANA